MGTFECDTSQNNRWVCPAMNGTFTSDQKMLWQHGERGEQDRERTTKQ